MHDVCAAGAASAEGTRRAATMEAKENNILLGGDYQWPICSVDKEVKAERECETEVSS